MAPKDERPAGRGCSTPLIVALVGLLICSVLCVGLGGLFWATGGLEKAWKALGEFQGRSKLNEQIERLGAELGVPVSLRRKAEERLLPEVLRLSADNRMYKDEYVRRKIEDIVTAQYDIHKDDPQRNPLRLMDRRAFIKIHARSKARELVARFGRHQQKSLKSPEEAAAGLIEVLEESKSSAPEPFGDGAIESALMGNLDAARMDADTWPK